MQPAENLLKHLLVTIEIQLDAAKKLNAESLQLATEKRQDLLFELELEQGRVQKTDEIVSLLEQIEKLDQRLMDVLEIVSDACRSANPSKSPTTYDNTGKLSGYKI
jgi:hypothetical protein